MSALLETDPVQVADPEDWHEQHVLVWCPGCAPAPGDDCPGLLYAWQGSDLLQVGDAVICPPTPHHDAEWLTRVMSVGTRLIPFPGYIKCILRRADVL